jgi:poly(3-hydroxybutyrate) depolymerase
MTFYQKDSSLGSKGLIYVPNQCKNQKCKLHVHFHGCQQQYDSLKELYAKHSGFNKWAESNNIVVLYPQTKSSFFGPSNPNACWDWWGYTNSAAFTKDGPQIQAIQKIIQQFQ